MYELKKMERYLRVNLLGPDPRLMKKVFIGPRSDKSCETLLYAAWRRKEDRQLWLKVVVLWNVTVYRLVEIDGRFGRTGCFHLRVGKDHSLKLENKLLPKVDELISFHTAPVSKGGNFLGTVVFCLPSQFSLMSLCSQEADMFASHATQITVMKFELEPQKTGAKKQLVPCLGLYKIRDLLLVTKWSLHLPNTSASNTVSLFVSYMNSLLVTCLECKYWLCDCSHKGTVWNGRRIWRHSQS